MHINPNGSRTKVELMALESDQLINAELTTERFAELDLKSGDVVFVSPRKVRVFVPQYSI
jgi:sulfate transport system ATP-binding protein